MMPDTQPLAELNLEAMRLLIRELGLNATLRFIQQFSPGSGNYTQDRRIWVDALSMEDILRELMSDDGRKSESA